MEQTKTGGPSVPLYRNLSITTLALIYMDLRESRDDPDDVESAAIASSQVSNLLRYVRGLGDGVVGVFTYEVGRLVCLSDDRLWPEGSQ